MNMGRVNGVLCLSFAVLCLYVICTLIGIFISSSELYVLPDFKLGLGSLCLQS